MELVTDKAGAMRELHESPRLLPLVDTWEALNLSKTLLYFLVRSGAVKRDEFIDVLQTFTQCAPPYLYDELHQRQEETRSWLSQIPVDKKRRAQRDSKSAAVHPDQTTKGEA
ncbi:hypothetical protein [Castellaniella caeni]|uniref:hypothetical protein n=1 Tax=Castellaniella caeni TaxID=266123 RepID=UPI000C9ED8DA|nr:hypothetical protein [Castellaniella caeni]